VLSASFEKSGTTMPTEGMLRLYIDAEKVGEAKIKTQPGKFSLAGEGLNVGLDRAEPVTADYPGESPWAFTGGTIRKVVVDVVGDPWTDLQKEAEAAFAGRLTSSPARGGEDPLAPPAPGPLEEQRADHERQRSSSQLERRRFEDRDPGVRDVRHCAWRVLRAARGAGRYVRQRRHAVV